MIMAWISMTMKQRLFDALESGAPYINVNEFNNYPPYMNDRLRNVVYDYRVHQNTNEGKVT